MAAHVSEYKVGAILTLTPCATKGKPLKACTVNVGTDEPITVVTAAPNVREGSRVAVAPVGSTFVGGDGEEIIVKKSSVGGVMSEGVFCDSRMLGWIGGSHGVAAQMPESLEIGQAPPNEKPIGVTFKEADQSSSSIPAVDVKPLFEKKLTKEEKKKLAEEKRKARKAAKEAKEAK